MTDPIGSSGVRGVQSVVDGGGGEPRASTAPVNVLPAPGMDLREAQGDAMALLYALTAKQGDSQTTQRASAAERKGTERHQAFEHIQEENKKAQDAKDDGGWLSDVTDVLDAAADAVVGGNPLQDVAHRLAETTGCKAFDLAYDFIRPDALLHGAVVLTSAAAGESGIAQTYDMAAGSSSLKTRFQGAADVTGEARVMEGYTVTRDGIATAMITVGTCGAGGVAIFAVASSAALMLEAKADLLGKIGLSDKAKMWVRFGAQAYVVAATAGGSIAGGAKGVSVGAKVATNIVNGTNQVARGSVKVGQAIYEHASSEHLTESAKYQNFQHRIDREQERIISGLREVSQSYQRSLETLASTIVERDAAPLMLARNIA